MFICVSNLKGLRLTFIVFKELGQERRREFQSLLILVD